MCGSTPTSTCSIAAGLVQIEGVDLEVSGQINDDRSFNYYGEPRSVTFTMRGNF